jgi:hypothetical protein
MHLVSNQCAGKVNLKTAQHEIASDWIEAYQKYMAKTPPAAEVHGQPQFVPETVRESEVLGAYPIRQILQAGLTLLRQNQAREIHD